MAEQTMEDLVTALENCAVTGTPGLAGWKRRTVQQLVAAIIAKVVPAGMVPEKLDKIAKYVELLDRMVLDVPGQTVTILSEPRTGETAMQDDLRAWAEHLRRLP